ncbi:TolB family protein [Aureliella helgolandensis]|uniref:Translocation protein TolB n=1 Tax=Aureliella helgolandensis TaxID=2527968 RepID=A0A518G4Y8_9BACT|nr:PD40 domain-containing protein [Aureliella helgolandensis]QDV23642.1 translocation protein TolB [Aureliella helgolandensis]
MKLLQFQGTVAFAIYLTWVPWASGQSVENIIAGKPSPDGSTMLFARYEDGQGVRDTEIYTARPDGSQQRKLTDNTSLDGYPDWSPDGRHIVFISNRSGTNQIHQMTSDGDQVRQLSTSMLGVGDLVKYGPDGRIAYIALREQQGKIKLYDLILTDGTVSKTLARRMRVTDFAWQADGNSIAYGGVGQIVFHDLNSDAKTMMKCEDIDARLHTHAVRHIHWQPNNESITCRIEFLGGRAQSENSPATKLFGDDELFTVTRDGKVSWAPIQK